MLIQEFRKQFVKVSAKLERQIDKLIARKCNKLGIAPEKCLELIKGQKEKKLPQDGEDNFFQEDEYNEVFDEDYIAGTKELQLQNPNEPGTQDTQQYSEEEDSEYEDVRDMIDQYKVKMQNQQAVSKEKMLMNFDQLNMSVITKQKSFVILDDSMKKISRAEGQIIQRRNSKMMIANKN